MYLHEFDDMRQGAELAVMHLTEIPDDGGKEIDGRLHKKVALLFDPLPVQPHQDSASGFGCVSDVEHVFLVQRVAPVGAAEIIKIDHIELWRGAI